jgi:hypothetical protein
MERYGLLDFGMELVPMATLFDGPDAVSKPTLDVITCRHQMAGMKVRMHDQISRPVPRAVTDVLDASVCDLATGAVGDAGAAQQMARRMLSDFQQAHPGSSVHPRADSRCQGREGRRP